MPIEGREVMDAGAWERLQAHFHDVVALASGAREAYMAKIAADDPPMGAQLRAMVEADAGPAPILDAGLAPVAHTLLTTGRSAVPQDAEFGPYRLVRLIGEGGMAAVYLAERRDLGSVAAVKLLHHGWLSSARRERFASEQRTLAQLNHPGIAHLHDAGTLPDGTQWIAMEYVEGQTLSEYCHTHALTIDSRLRLFRDVCDAVQHAHGMLVIHRDLKPTNILVTADGRVKLLDFGIAKQLDPVDQDDQRTRTGLQLMTPAYAAPEQVRGERTGVYTDVYALGVVLYELLAGRLPYDLSRTTPGESEALIVAGAPERPSVHARATMSGASAGAASWADLDVLCLTAMHREPSRRYRTVDALVRDIDHYLRHEPLEARPDSAGYRLAKFIRRHRTRLAAGGAALATLIAMSALYAVRIRDARDAAVTEAERAQRVQRFTLSLFEGGAEGSEPGDSLRAVTLVERGVVEAATLATAPLVQAELYQTLGGIFQKLGQLERADTMLQRSLASRRTLAAEHPDVARSLVALGLLRVDQARLPEAEQLVRDGLALSQRTRPVGHIDVAVATSALGRVLEERADYANAITVTRDALRLHAAIAPLSVDVATAATHLGNNYFYAGDYSGADSLFRRSLTVARQLYGDRHPLVADALINLGAVRFQRGDYSEAERLDRDGLAIIQRVYGADDPRTAAALTMLGRALVAQSRFDEAVPLAQQALAIQERVFGPVSPRVASTVNELGIIALRRKQYDEADAYFARNADIYRAVFKAPHNLLGTALANRGSVFAARGANADAERLFREAIDVFAKTVAPTHLDIGIARVKLGRVLLRQRRFADAERESAAGLAILLQQTSPATSWVKNARSDLAQVYDSLHLTEKAAALRVALADTLARN
ncbi:MAG: serine/threonine-protein kinase [Gemmatimonadaceae bacterium]|nr:serine/threonine-protein kinase [Gemmatimonadaceae bacterium]